MLIKNVENKIRLAFFVSTITIIAAVIICGMAFFFAYQQIDKERNKIYVMQNNVPNQANLMWENREVEYKGLVDTYHQLFFTVAPDDKQIQYNIKKAMNLIDNTGLKEYNNLKEQGFFTSIISSSAFVNVQTDSIKYNPSSKEFVYYGRQIITRLSSTLVRSLVTAGEVKDIIRSESNPFGAIIVNWRTISNKDVSSNTRSF